MTFEVDQRIESSCFKIVDWELSRVFLKNNADYPWCILVPRQANIQDIDQLSLTHQHTLIQEISRLSSIIKDLFQPDKINVGALGNIVSQLHIHVIARFTHDKLWPHGIWQETPSPMLYQDQQALFNLLKALREACL